MVVKKNHRKKKKVEQREGQDAGLGSSAILSQSVSAKNPADHLNSTPKGQPPT